MGASFKLSDVYFAVTRYLDAKVCPHRSLPCKPLASDQHSVFDFGFCESVLALEVKIRDDYESPAVFAPREDAFVLGLTGESNEVSFIRRYDCLGFVPSLVDRLAVMLLASQDSWEKLLHYA